MKNIYFINDIPNGSLDLFGSKLFQIDADSILIIKIFCLAAAVINYLIYTLDAFTCADKLIYLQTTPQRSHRDYHHQYQIIGNGNQNMIINS